MVFNLYKLWNTILFKQRVWWDLMSDEIEFPKSYLKEIYHPTSTWLLTKYLLLQEILYSD